MTTLTIQESVHRIVSSCWSAFQGAYIPMSGRVQTASAPRKAARQGQITELNPAEPSFTREEGAAFLKR